MKNGFILVETVIVMCIVCTGLLSLYSVYSDFETKNSNLDYYNVENVYKAKALVADYTGELSVTDLACGYGIYQSTSFENSSEIKKQELYQLFTNFDIERAFVLDANLNILSSNCKSNLLQNFSGSTINYFRFIANKIDIHKNTMIVETKKGNNTFYGYYQY